MRHVSGVSLIEIVLAIAVLGIVMTSVVRIFGISMDLVDQGEKNHDLIQTTRIISNRICTELERATVIRMAKSGKLSFEMLTDQGVIQTIEYGLSPIGNLERTVDGGLEVIMAENVTEFNCGGIKLWSKLGSDGDVYNPETGSGATYIFGNAGYMPNKFGDGICCYGSQAMQPMFPSKYILNHSKGTIEFWSIPEYSATDTGKAQKEKYMIDSTGSWWGERIELFFDKPSTMMVFRINGSDFTRLDVATPWQKGDLVHIAIVWDSVGKELPGGRTMAMYINGTMASEAIPETTTWTPGKFDAGYFCFGSWAGKEAEACFDNIKVYDYCKTNFNDRNQEVADGLVTFELTVSDGSDSITLPNCASIM